MPGDSPPVLHICEEAMRYIYYCDHCKLEFDRTFPLGKAEEEMSCPICQRQSRRIYTVPFTIYKGTGWTGVGHGVPDMDERAKLPGPLEFGDLMED